MALKYSSQSGLTHMPSYVIREIRWDSLDEFVASHPVYVHDFARKGNWRAMPSNEHESTGLPLVTVTSWYDVREMIGLRDYFTGLKLTMTICLEAEHPAAERYDVSPERSVHYVLDDVWLARGNESLTDGRNEVRIRLIQTGPTHRHLAVMLARWTGVDQVRLCSEAFKSFLPAESVELSDVPVRLRAILNVHPDGGKPSTAISHASSTPTAEEVQDR